MIVLPDRIESKIEYEPMSGCWLWAAATTTAGYGHVWWRGALAYAHRLVYELLIGPIGDGLEMDHLCGNPPCVNPEHLEPVNHQVNIKRGRSSSSEKTHCPQGHPYDEANTKFIASRPNARYCRACHRIHAAASRARGAS